MIVGFEIICRMSSSRLPGKTLRDLNGKPVLQWIVERVRAGVGDAPIVVTTSTDPSDNPLEAYCAREGWACFRGSLDNVSRRFLDCAQAHEWDYAARINGDNVLADPETLRAMLALARSGAYDFVTNVPGRTFPYGMSVEIVRKDFYAACYDRFTEPGDFEHVTKWLYDHPEVGRRCVLENRFCPRAAGFKLALDREEDAEYLGRVLRELPAEGGLREVFGMVSGEKVDRPWWGKYGPLLIAEIGGNHEGDFEYAKKLTRLAIATNVDYVKFQLYRGDTLVNPLISPDRNAHFKTFELTRAQHEELAAMCHEGGVGYLASVWDPDFLDWVDPHVRMYKVGSGDLTAYPVLRAIAARGKPIILATGLATLDEVKDAIAFLARCDARYAQPEWLALLQCTSMYPIPPEDANLAAMHTLKEATGLPVGYSDHTEGDLALKVAAAMGAEVLEFHFTDSREGKTFRDHKVSLTPDEVAGLEVYLVGMKRLQGDGIKRPLVSEIASGHVESFRRALYPSRDLPEGHRLERPDLACLRPNKGRDARAFDHVIGAHAVKALRKYEIIDNEALDCS